MEEARGSRDPTSSGRSPLRREDHALRAGRWTDDETCIVDGVEFICRTLHRFPSTPGRFHLVKRPDLVRGYEELLHRLEPSTIVEVGVLQGGSVAFASLVAEPELLVAFELSPDRVPALDALIRSRGLTERIHVHHGVNQADRETLIGHLAAVGIGPDRPLDLVVDDASHLVHETRQTFEALFPLLRPGGVFVVEDWAWAHVGYGSQFPDERPLSELVFELVFAAAGPDVVARVDVDRDWAAVTRGPAELPADGSFAIRDLYNSRSAAMLPPA